MTHQLERARTSFGLGERAVKAGEARATAPIFIRCARRRHRARFNSPTGFFARKVKPGASTDSINRDTLGDPTVSPYKPRVRSGRGVLSV